MQYNFTGHSRVLEVLIYVLRNLVIFILLYNVNYLFNVVYNVNYLFNVVYMVALCGDYRGISVERYVKIMENL